MKLVLSGAVVLMAMMSTPGTAVAQDVSCDAIYMVQPGDSLSKIARRAYGRTTAYQIIFDYNPGIMTDPNLVPSGVGLYIPCSEEAIVPAAEQSQNQEPQQEALPELPPATSNRLRILTGSEYPPYVDEGLPNGGFSVELIERGLLANNGAEDFRVDVINDWASHLRPLLSDGAYDMGFPWFRPDCAQPEKLGESSTWRCDNLRYSEPLHDVVVSFHALNEVAETIKSEADLQGLRICRPRGYFTHDLEALGLNSTNYEHVAPRQPVDCFEQMMDGTVDVVTVNADTSDQALGQLDIRDQVTEMINFANVQGLHAVVLKSNPNGRVHLLRLNKGLITLRNNGDFRKIADTHLRGQ